MKRMLFMVLGALFLVSQAFAEDLTTAVVGRWTAEGKALEFYGQNIGRSVAETTRPSTELGAGYFKYDFPADGQIAFNYGGGSTETCAISITNSELHLIDASQQETVYTKSETNLNACVQNLRQLDGAMSLYSLDHGGICAENPRALIPAYLATLPICPDGGIYNLGSPDGHPICTMEGHRFGE